MVVAFTPCDMNSGISVWAKEVLGTERRDGMRGMSCGESFI